MVYTPEEYAARVCSVRKCVRCSAPIEHDTSQLTVNEDVCEDCYWDQLGNLIEEHPIGTPGRS